MSYLALKTLHVLLVTVFLGVGSASVFYKVMADRSRDTAVICATMNHLVLADTIFILPSVIGLPLTGLTMVGWSLSSAWIQTVLVLYLLAGLPWLLAVKLQFDMRALARRAHAEQAALDPSYWSKSRLWMALGLPSFTLSLLLLVLMVYKRLPWQ